MRRMILRSVLCAFIFCFGLNAFSQQTIGLFQNAANATEGYTLFGPLGSNSTYLINNCGQKVHEWQSTVTPGNVVYLLENGSLLHTGRIPNSTFNVGGYGGRIEMLDWNSNVTWTYDYSNNDHCQHHDVQYLPNGNVLIIAWELKTTAEAIAQGRNPSLLNGNLWPDHILELMPMSPGGASIVWEWHAWDHLVQDFDSLKPNFGVVADLPERINLNYASQGLGGYSDWLHSNAISYNPLLDQIILSVHNFNEVWIIDHSTTTAEAASHSGGLSGKGGDLIYRWGNPITYGRGTTADKKLFGQHDAQWVPAGDRYAGQIMVYNNGLQRPGGNHSTIDIFNPPLDLTGNYTLLPGQAYGPSSFSWTWQDNPAANFYSSGISGAQRLPGNHTLICEGTSGHFFELDSNGTVIWDYVNPVNGTGPMTQGDAPIGNSVFRCYRYAPNYAGFSGQTLVQGDRIELNPLPLPSNCVAAALDEFATVSSLKIYPNPFSNMLSVECRIGQSQAFELYDFQGKQIYTTILLKEKTNIDFTNLPNGIYIAKLQGQTQFWKIKKY